MTGAPDSPGADPGALAAHLALARSGSGIENYHAAESAAALFLAGGDLDALLALAVHDRLAREFVAEALYSRGDELRLLAMAMDGSPAGCRMLALLYARRRNRSALAGMRALVTGPQVTIRGAVDIPPGSRTPAPAGRPPTDADERPNDAVWRNPSGAADCANYWWALLRAMEGDRAADREALEKLGFLPDTDALEDLVAAGSEAARVALAAREAAGRHEHAELRTRRMADEWMREAGLG